MAAPSNGSPRVDPAAAVHQRYALELAAAGRVTAAQMIERVGRGSEHSWGHMLHRLARAGLLTHDGRITDAGRAALADATGRRSR